MEKEKQSISSEIRPLIFEISLSKGKSVDNIIENNQEFLNKKKIVKFDNYCRRSI